jgi:hypothetical protein
LAAASTKGGSGISVVTAARHNSGMEWIGQEWREGTGGLREMRRVSSFVGNDTWLQRVVRARCLTDLFLTTQTPGGVPPRAAQVDLAAPHAAVLEAEAAVHGALDGPGPLLRREHRHLPHHRLHVAVLVQRPPEAEDEVDAALEVVQALVVVQRVLQL